VERAAIEDFFNDYYAQFGWRGKYTQSGRGCRNSSRDIKRMMYTNLNIDLQGDKAVATMLWHSVKSDLLTSPPKITEYGTERTEPVKQEGRSLISKRVILSEGGMPEWMLESYPKQ
jgi:hypothetical protein